MRFLGSGLAIMCLLLASCANPLASDENLSSPTEAQIAELCAVVAQGNQRVTDAAPKGIAALAMAKVQYFRALDPVAPDVWQDNLEIIRPAWETLAEIAELAGDNSDKIDFPKFQADFSDAIDNEAALEAYTSLLCNSDQ